MAGQIVGPVVARPPQYAHWVVRAAWLEPLEKKVSQEEKKAPRPPVPIPVVEYLKGPRVTRTIRQFYDGDVRTTWVYNRIILDKYANSQEVMLTEVPAPGAGEEIEGYDMDEFWLKRYLGLEWIKPQHFVGEEIRNELPCLHFVKRDRGGENSEAWVTVQGRWPVEVHRWGIRFTFQHLQPPSAGSFPRMDPYIEKELVTYCKAWGLPEPKY